MPTDTPPRKNAQFGRTVRAFLLTAFLIASHSPPTVHAQVPVVDNQMAAYNSIQTGQQIIEKDHENKKVDVLLRLLLKMTAYDGRDLDGAVAELEAILDAADVLGYTRADLASRLEETFPGYADHVDWAAHHTARIQRAHSTYRAVLLSMREQQRRWEGDLEALDALRDNATSTIQLGHPGGEGSQQTMMEVRAAARLLGQEEAMMIRHALMNRALIRNLRLANAAHLRGHRAATLERMLGVDE